MKNVLVFISALVILLFSACSEDVVSSDDLENRSGLFYIIGEEDPYSGSCVDYYNDTSRLSERVYKDGMLHGKYSKWYSSGQISFEGNYNNGVESGTYKRWYKNGNLKLSRIDNGERQKEQKWFENGILKSEVNLINDTTFDGVVNEWYENGNILTEAIYKVGVLDGKIKSWYENGILKVEVEYREGLAHGEWTMWYENGNKEAFEIYDKNKKVGEWRYWHENGQIKAVLTMRDSKIIRKSEWNNNGNMIENISLQ